MPAVPLRFDLIRRSRVLDYRIFQGSRWTLALSFPATWGVDWAGFSARAQLRRGPRDRYPDDVQATITAWISNPGPAQRCIQFDMDAETTEAIKASSGTWDCEIVNGNTVWRIVNGIWRMAQETTE